MTITPNSEEDVSYEELKKELDYLSKEWDIHFLKYLSGWEIVGYNKKRFQPKNKEVKR